MIEQKEIGLNSRAEANIIEESLGKLPLITAPMYSVVDEHNYQYFLDNNINVCLPRSNKYIETSEVFISLSLNDFIDRYITNSYEMTSKSFVCIDTANGNMPKLHDAIVKAKGIHNDMLIIMAGNVGSAKVFVELAATGVDYIRVGLGGGDACTTTKHTGVGQKNLCTLIEECHYDKISLQLVT